MIQERKVAPEGWYKQLLPLNMWQECQSHMELSFWLVRLALVFEISNEVGVHSAMRGAMFLPVPVTACWRKRAREHTTQKQSVQIVFLCSRLAVILRLCALMWEWINPKGEIYTTFTATRFHTWAPACQTKTNACVVYSMKLGKKLHLNTHCSRNSDQTVKLGSADHVWIKITLMHCLFFASNVFRIIFQHWLPLCVLLWNKGLTRLYGGREDNKTKRKQIKSNWQHMGSINEMHCDTKKQNTWTRCKYTQHMTEKRRT